MSLAKKARDLPYERGCRYGEVCPFESIYNYHGDVQVVEDAIISFAASVGIRVDVTSRLRSCCEQARLYAAGQTTARPTTSQHEFGLAVDFVPVSGYQRYDATKADAVQWIIALARYWGFDGLVEATHAHVQMIANDRWREMIIARDAGLSIPIPGKRPKSGT